MEVLKSIVNWELWQKIQKPRKIETEINFSSRVNLTDFTLTKDKLPKKGKEIIGFDSEGNMYNCYMVGYDDLNIIQWVDSYKQKQLNVDILIWRYDDTYLWV
jgi:hypothetical protein